MYQRILPNQFHTSVACIQKLSDVRHSKPLEHDQVKMIQSNPIVLKYLLVLFLNSVARGNETRRTNDQKYQIVRAGVFYALGVIGPN